ncbi:adenosylmethionine decarboxylase [Clostridium sp. Cult2]|uniref:adenosylmethionine decarboxylase n=1 Tax=Clostridium sp. Cult2 TaxID=2079003 RepID=UPI001F02EA4A|nr:adenosylmethionine decarboxylase [Clostridium sp. Cult2]MCF6464318.1 S-adenosylmethionine decarboxylase proenzyme [Clostridium sp. Cult2]
MEDRRLGRHILVEFYNCDNQLLNDAQLIEKYMVEAANKAKATVVKSVFHTFNPWGVSGVVVIQESHLTIHTWPEYGYAAIDLFTCGEEVDPWIAFQYLNDKLKAEKTETFEIDRGEVNKIYYYSNGKYNNIVYKPQTKGLGG